MKRFSTLVAVLVAALMLTACTKCSQQPVEPPPMVSPEGTPPAMEGEMTADPMDAAPMDVMPDESETETPE